MARLNSFRYLTKTQEEICNREEQPLGVASLTETTAERFRPAHSYDQRARYEVSAYPRSAIFN